MTIPKGLSATDIKEYHRLHYLNNREGRLASAKKYYSEHVKTNPERAMWTQARLRARKSGLDFNIEVSDVIIPEFCPIKLLKLEHGKGVPTQYSPTLDRINTLKGYIKGNVRVISNHANRCKSSMTLDDIKRLYDYSQSTEHP